MSPPAERTQRPAGRRLPAAGLVRALVVAGFVCAIYVQSQNFISVLSLSAIWGIAAVGLGLVLGSAGQISLCQASFVMAGAYCYAAVTTEWNASPLAGIAASILGGALVALLVSPVLRAKGNYLALATITLAILIDRLISTGDWIPGGNSGITGIPFLEVFGFTFDSDEKYLALTAVLLVAIIAVLHSRYGRGQARRAIQALHHDESVLAGFGGNGWWLKREIFIVGGLLGGFAGGLYAGAFGFVSTNGFGLFESFALALAVFIGGNGRLIGALFGALVYQGSFVVLGERSDYRFVLLGLVVILAVHFFPRGLWPSREDFVGWIPQRRHDVGTAVESVEQELPAVDPLGLEVRHVTKRFGGLKALDDVSVRFAPGSLTALIGPNGAGKTTLLDVIAGDQEVTDGAVVINELDITGTTQTRRARAGMTRTYQRLRLVPSLSVIENVMVGVDQAARSKPFVTERERRRFAETALGVVGLRGLDDAEISSLTFGQRRLVEMARAIAATPRMVLLDEPSSGLNDAEARNFAEVVRRVHSTGCTVVIVEHNLPFVRAVAHDIVALDRGRLLAHGSTEEVFASAEFQKSYVGVSTRRSRTTEVPPTVAKET